MRTQKEERSKEQDDGTIYGLLSSETVDRDSWRTYLILLDTLLCEYAGNAEATKDLTREVYWKKVGVFRCNHLNEFAPKPLQEGGDDKSKPVPCPKARAPVESNPPLAGLPSKTPLPSPEEAKAKAEEEARAKKAEEDATSQAESGLRAFEGENAALHFAYWFDLRADFWSERLGTRQRPPVPASDLGILLSQLVAFRTREEARRKQGSDEPQDFPDD